MSATIIRQKALIEILDEHEVSTQHQLQDLLTRRGFAVTQATVSRDLEHAGAVRVRRHGRLVYALPVEGAEDEDPLRAVRRVLGMVRHMEASSNLLVLRTGPANAHPVALAFDNADLPEIVGSIAGDDTLALVAREPNTGRDLHAMVNALKGDGHAG